MKIYFQGNRPTPGPSQEGNSASAPPDIDSPPPEGLGMGSWPRCASKFWRFLLSMNPPHPALSPSEGERVPEGRVRGGSWSQYMRKNERRLLVPSSSSSFSNSSSTGRLGFE